MNKNWNPGQAELAEKEMSAHKKALGLAGLPGGRRNSGLARERLDSCDLGLRSRSPDLTLFRIHKVFFSLRASENGSRSAGSVDPSADAPEQR